MKLSIFKKTLKYFKHKTRLYVIEKVVCTTYDTNFCYTIHLYNNMTISCIMTSFISMALLIYISCHT